MTTDVQVTNTTPAATLARPPMIEVQADRVPIGPALVALVASSVPVYGLGLPWWVSILVAALVGAGFILAETFFSPLKEPIVRLSSTWFLEGEEVLLECELRARQAATLRDICAGLQSVERNGEDSHTESYGEWTLTVPTRRLDTTPVVARGRLHGPARRPRQWSHSRLNWYVTLRVELEDGTLVRRRYPCR